MNKLNIEKLFLDDIRIPTDCCTYMHYENINLTIYHEEWIIVRSYKQFINYIEQNGLPEIISFDHDLADFPETRELLHIEEWFNILEEKEYTGMDCAKWLVNYCIDNKCILPKFIVHSQNPIGKKNIQELLNNFNNKYN